MSYLLFHLSYWFYIYLPTPTLVFVPPHPFTTFATTGTWSIILLFHSWEGISSTSSTVELTPYTQTRVLHSPIKKSFVKAMVHPHFLDCYPNSLYLRSIPSKDSYLVSSSQIDMRKDPLPMGKWRKWATGLNASPS